MSGSAPESHGNARAFRGTSGTAHRETPAAGQGGNTRPIPCIGFALIAVVCSTMPTHADEFKYSKGPLAPLSFTTLYYEVEEDYSVNLWEDWFSKPELLPKSRRRKRRNDWGWTPAQIMALQNHVKALPDKRWDFVELAGGVLTVKQGFRWDGASTFWKTIGVSNNRKWMLRGSCMHDSLYDLMRMGYLDHDDTKDPDYGDTGFMNRLMADCLMHMLFCDDRGKTKQFQFRGVRALGASNTVGDAKLLFRPILRPYKYHASELTAWEEAGNVHLHFRRADDAGEDPRNYDDEVHSYVVRRHEVVGTGQYVNSVDLGPITDSLDPAHGEYYDEFASIQFTDTSVEVGKTYVYQVISVHDLEIKPWLFLSRHMQRFDFTNMSPPVCVPEPATVALLGLGMMTVIRRGARRDGTTARR